MKRMAATRKQPLDFRKAEVSYIMQRWKAGDSCSLVGIGSVGKSNLIQHLSDTDVQAHYLDTPANLKAILVDPNLLGALPADADEQFRCWAGYELMMHRLFLAFYPFEEIPAEEARRFYETYQAFQDGTNPLYAYMGLRYFELGLDFFLRRGAQIVFMFDEFEEMLRLLPVKFFQTLRGLRDSNKPQLSYLTFTRAPLPSLVETFEIPTLMIEPFVELFTDNICFVGPYHENDARRMLDDLAQRNNQAYPDTARDFLLDASGRFAGLLRAAFRAFEPMSTQPISPDTRDTLLTQLANKAAIRAECRTIWASLSEPEREVLQAVALLKPHNITPETEQAVTLLVQKRLLSVDRMQHKLEVNPPLLRAFVLAAPDKD